jgi:hypothetical protein
VTDNTIDGADYAIHFFGGSKNTVCSNVVRSCRVGIVFQSARDNSDLVRSRIHGNLILGNVVRDITEEGISLDSSNSARSWPEHPVVQIVTYNTSMTQGNNMKVLVQDTGQSPDWATNYFMVFLTGASRGHAGEIVASGSDWLSVRRSEGDFWTEAADGDKMLITLGHFRNIIANNSVSTCGTCHIVLWGSAWFNIISGNTIEVVYNGFRQGAGIYVCSVVNPSGTGPGAGMRCYSGFDVIENNTAYFTGAGDEFGSTGAPIIVSTVKYTYADIPETDLTPCCVVRGNVVMGGRGIYGSSAANLQLDHNLLSGSGKIILESCTDPALAGNRANTRLLTL